VRPWRSMMTKARGCTGVAGSSGHGLMLSMWRRRQ
jgi:hypothetical protein